MHTFPVKYFDGQSSKSYDAYLSFNRNDWLIKYEDGVIEKKVVWELNKVHKKEIVGSFNVFKYGDFPHQVIECNDPTLIDFLLKEYPNSHLFDKKFTFLRNVTASKLAMMFVLVIVATFSFYWWGLPSLAEQIAVRVPTSYEVSLGNLAYNSIIKDYEIDSVATEKVNKLVQELDFETDYDIEVTVVDEWQLNAFALPGGKIVIFDALLKKIKTHEALVALLAHEVAHIKHRHSMRLMSRNLSTYAFLSVLFGDVNGVMVILLENANQLHNLSFSRSLEQDADNTAIEFLKKNNLNVAGLVDLLELLQDESENYDFLQFLSSHPLTQDRIDIAKFEKVGQPTPKTQPELVAIWEEIELSFDYNYAKFDTTCNDLDWFNSETIETIIEKIE